MASCVAGPRPSSGYALEPALDGETFEMPVDMMEAPNAAGRFYVVEKRGRVRIVAKGRATATFADLRSRINATPQEAGLLGLAFHPQFATNGLVYFSFTKPSATSPANLRSVIARARSADGGKTIDPASLVELLSFDQPFANHNGGHIAFGPAGLLYAAFGDGGSAGDPTGNGQNKNTLFGKIVRIDVDGASPYAIPPTNPFASGGGRKEIFAYGFRNPWRFSFDRATGDLWAGDVGQSTWEEIDKVVLGGNYGWRVREGNHCYGASSCPSAGLVPPVYEYSHDDGVSVTGGFVYRGVAMPALVGSYVFGDFGTGRISAISTTGSPNARTLVQSSLRISSFAEDRAGELYVLDFVTGAIKALVAKPASGGIPQRLSQTGCFVASDPRKPVAKLVPYAVNSPLWSDGAQKRRWLALPSGGQIRVDDDGDFGFPSGTVLVKEFSLDGKRVETRLFMRHTDGGWGGYSYEWNASETEATLLPDGKTKDVGGKTWTFPSRGQCFACHTPAAGNTLGLEVAQLNRSFVYPDGTTRNQLDYLEARGLFSEAKPLPSAPHPKLPSPADGAATPAARARSYLHANCSFCHRPGGLGRGVADLRFGRSLADTHVCNANPEAGSLGVAGAKLLAPGAPLRSLLSVRMHATGAARMPPLATTVVDPTGTAVVDGWISGLTACP